MSHWRTDIGVDNEAAALENFITEVYEPLAQTRFNSRQKIKEIQSLILGIKEKELTHPNQASLIQSLRKQWTLAHTALYQTYIETDREVRIAWIAHTTMNRQDVLLKFSKQAVQINHQMISAQAEYDKHLVAIHDELIKVLDGARKLIDTQKKPSSDVKESEKQLAINQSIREAIQPLQASVIVELLAFIASLDKELEADLNDIHELIRVASQQSALIDELLHKNQDLEQPLNKVIEDWKQLEDRSSKRLNEIYYAIEVEYLLLQFALSAEEPAVKAMNQSLSTVIPLMKKEEFKQKEVIDHSYSVDQSR